MKPLNFDSNLGSRLQFAKTFVLGLLIGAFFTALWLDQRYLAIMKAFRFPTVVNSLEVKVEVKK